MCDSALARLAIQQGACAKMDDLTGTYAINSQAVEQVLRRLFDPLDLKCCEPC